MRITLCVFVLLFVTSCSKNLSDPNDFGKYLFDNLISQRTDKIKELYLSEKDSNRLIDKNIQMVFFMMEQNRKQDDYVNYIKRQDDEVSEWYNIAIKKGLTSMNTSFLRSKLDSCYLLDYKLLTLKIHFLHNDKEDYFLTWDVIKIKDGWAIRHLNTPTSEEEMRQLPFTPQGLSFTNWNWRYKYQSIKTFSEFFITLSNKTGNDFDFIKYRVTISDSSGNPVFKKTYEKNEKIYNDNMTRFEVPDLKDFYVGVDVSIKDNFKCEVEVLDAKPRPDSAF